MPEITAPVKVITMTINGNELSARDNETVMDVAEENGIEIPALCHLPGLSDVGACRLCVVEVVGVPRLLPACVTMVTEGMAVVTHSEKINKYRKTLLEMLFAERNHICSVCVSNGHCELQDMALACDVEFIHLPYLSPKLKVDASHPRFVFDPNRCILCTRCVRVCDEIEGAHTWDIQGRGVDARIIADLGEPWGESQTCTSCSKCVHVCPTGALSEKGRSVAEMRKRRQFLPYLATMREVKR